MTGDLIWYRWQADMISMSSWLISWYDIDDRWSSWLISWYDTDDRRSSWLISWYDIDDRRSSWLISWYDIDDRRSSWLISWYDSMTGLVGWFDMIPMTGNVVWFPHMISMMTGDLVDRCWFPDMIPMTFPYMISMSRRSMWFSWYDMISWYDIDDRTI